VPYSLSTGEQVLLWLLEVLCRGAESFCLKGCEKEQQNSAGTGKQQSNNLLAKDELNILAVL